MVQVAAKARRPRRLTPIALQRALRADRWVPRYARALRRALNKQSDAFAAEVARDEEPRPQVLRWATELENEKKRWVYAMVLEGFEIASAEVGGKTAPTWKAKQDEVRIAGRRGRTGKPVDVTQRGGEFLTRADFNEIDDWVETTSLAETKTQANRLASVWKSAVASRDPKTGAAWTVKQISQQIQAQFRRRVNPARADMLARTGSIWAMNEGAQQRYHVAGVRLVEWDATIDAVTCPWCQGMDGKIVRTKDPFWRAGSEYAVRVPTGKTDDVDAKVARGKPATTRRVLRLPFEVQHPPLHPSCRCALLPVIRAPARRR